MSDDEEYYYGSAFTRQRRTLRSCDFCRQRKIRCQRPPSVEDDDGPCSSCRKFGTPCTFTHPVGKRGPKNRLVEDLRREIASLKAQLQSQSLGVCRLCAQPLGTHAQGDKNVFHHSSPESDTTLSSEPGEPPEEEDAPTDELSARFSQFSLESMKTSYFGSAFAIGGNGITTKAKYDGRPLPRSRRPVYWEMSPWEKEAYDIRSQYETRPNYVFPDRDLIDSLVALYFANFHITTPILHRPSFEQAVAEGLYVRDMAFGGLLLAVLALASRYSSDPRVLIDGNSLSAGWRFQSQIRVLRRLFQPTIYEIQMYCLMSYYAIGGSVPQVAWVYIGIGLRFLQQRGENVRKPPGHRESFEDELWKRTFWGFAVIERMLCIIMGRPMGLHIENYDIDFPAEVDDEYWGQGTELIQPAGVPSRLSYLVHHLRLVEIVGQSVRKLYGSKKSKLMLGWDGPQWEQRIAAELDSEMDRFFASIPVHLRWDPASPPEGVFFDQSATLHLTFNYVRIAIHRPFIRKGTGGSASPSLAICCDAARKVIHIADTWVSKFQRIPMPSLINPVFIAGIILVLNMMATKRAGLPMDNNREDTALVDAAMEILKFGEFRLQTVGRLRDLLGELRSIDDPSPQDTPTNPVGPSSATVPDAFYSHVTSSTAYSDSVAAGGPSSNIPYAFHSQLPAFAGYGNYEQYQGPRLEQSVDELLGDSRLYTMEGILDDELLSVWMAGGAPTDITNLRNWDAYLENRNNVHVDAGWNTRYGAAQG